jgi:alcohol dehydrogenase class IV
VTFCNLSNVNAAMRSALLEVIEVHLVAVGGGSTLDFEDATAFLAEYQPMIDMAMARRASP